MWGFSSDGEVVNALDRRDTSMIEWPWANSRTIRDR
jgi:hypothetical protein